LLKTDTKVVFKPFSSIMQAVIYAGSLLKSFAR
jgi:hypothetical protein